MPLLGPRGYTTLPLTKHLQGETAVMAACPKCGNTDASFVMERSILGEEPLILIIRFLFVAIMTGTHKVREHIARIQQRRKRRKDFLWLTLHERTSKILSITNWSSSSKLSVIGIRYQQYSLHCKAQCQSPSRSFLCTLGILRLMGSLGFEKKN